jgi:hypothetical protein
VSPAGLAAGRAPARSRGYGELVEACRAEGCPLCRCLRAAARRHLATLLGEHVTDPVTRRRLGAAGGFCATHAAALREVPDAALGVALLAEGLLADARRWLGEARRAGGPGRPGSGWRRLLGRSASGAVARGGRRGGAGRCPACVETAGAERRYLDTLVRHLADPELARAFAASAGLCLPHVRLARAQAPDHPGVALLLERTLAKLDGLETALRGFIARHDHRRRGAFTEAEAASWTGALGFLAGHPALFGPEVPRTAGDRP